MLETPHSAPDDITADATSETSAEPTTVLAAHATAHPSDVPFDSVSSEGTSNAAPEDPTHQLELDREAAIRSLDETILRPVATPIDFGRTPDGTPAADTPSPASTTSAFSWKRAGLVATMAAIALAVVIRAQGSRQTHVGFLGVAQPVAEQGAESVIPLEAHVDEPAETDETAQDEEAWGEAPVEEVSPEETSDETDDEYDVQGPPTWGYVIPSPNDGQNDQTDSSEDENDYPTQEEELSRHHTFRWDLNDTWGTEGSNGNDTESAPTLDDDRSFSYTFDGGNVTYYYDDNTVTFDLDAVDEIEQHMDEYDVWRYLFGEEYNSTATEDEQSYPTHRPRGW